MRLSIFLPVYNEEDILMKNTLAVYDEAKKLRLPFEIIICDDSSKDRTNQICLQLAKEFKEISFIKYENGPSRRENLALAMKGAKGEIVFYSDIDLSVNPKYMPELIAKLNEGFDIATGSRYAAKTRVERRFFRKAISYAYNLFMRIYFCSKVKDHQCGFKAFRKEILLELIKELGYDSKFRRGWFWDAELLLRAQRKRLKIAEVPVNWQGDMKSSFRIKRELRMLPYVLALKWRL
ncbi:MAG: glycosyltransferase [Candidatus Woesearchaeota archaeon]